MWRVCELSTDHDVISRHPAQALHVSLQDSLTRRKMSSDAQQNSSPTKSWVQFNDDDGDATKAGTNVSSPGTC